jgi:aspartate kinase
MEYCSDYKVVVIKLGGSILVSEDSYRQAAKFLVRRLHECSRERFVVVVSAQGGQTDELETLARSVTRYPNPRTLDLLWSTGELRSVALLTLHLENMGIPVVAMNAHEAGLRRNRSDRIETTALQVETALSEHSIAVVPGFFGTTPNGTLFSLGRGGSDLSAVLLAEALHAQQCELLKDVAGYFSEDPNLSEAARHLPRLSYEQALTMASEGCELVQLRALEAARNAGLCLVVRSLIDDAPASIVSLNGSGHESSHGGEEAGEA